MISGPGREILHLAMISNVPDYLSRIGNLGSTDHVNNVNIVLCDIG